MSNFSLPKAEASSQKEWKEEVFYKMGRGKYSEKKRAMIDFPELVVVDL